MQFEFATAGRILFGPGRSSEAGTIARSLGRNAFVVVDSLDRAAKVLAHLQEAGIEVTSYPIKGEPTTHSISAALARARESRYDMVIGMGGGSALDTGKTVAILLTNPGEVTDYLEVIGLGRTLENPSIPYIGIPTTAGTGSEVTRNAVIGSPEQRVKASLRSPYMLPRVAIVDPELTYSLPPEPTASTGMDALTQLIEPFIANTSNPLVDAICREGIPLAARSLVKAYQNGEDAAARQDMSLASLLGGLALANGKLGGVHGMANPIGGVSRAPHGAICARLLPLVMEANIRKLRKISPDSPSLLKYNETARLLTGKTNARAEEGIAWVTEMCQALNIRPLGEYGLNSEDFPALVQQSQKANSMKGNAIRLEDGEILGLLEKAI